MLPLPCSHSRQHRKRPWIDVWPALRGWCCGFLAALAVSGCADYSNVARPDVPDGAPPVYEVPTGEAGPKGPIVTDVEAAEVEPQDIIESGDLVEIVVRRGAGEERYQAPVRASGVVTVAFQQINIKGLTEEQAEERITKELSRVIRNPTTQVRIMQKGATKAKNYYMIGEVRSPGKFPLTRKTTVLQAVSIASGYTDTAMLDRVVVISRQAGRKPLIRVVNMKLALISGDQSPDVALNDNDIVFVPRNAAGDFFTYYTKVASPIINTVFTALNAVFIGKTLDQAFRTPVDQPAQAAVPVCWVAGVLYGEQAWQTNLLRWYITGPLSEHRAGRWFANLYRRYGREAAALLKEHPALQAAARPLFDWLLDRAIREADRAPIRSASVRAQR